MANGRGHPVGSRRRGMVFPDFDAVVDFACRNLTRPDGSVLSRDEAREQIRVLQDSGQIEVVSAHGSAGVVLRMPSRVVG